MKDNDQDINIANQLVKDLKNCKMKYQKKSLDNLKSLNLLLLPFFVMDIHYW